ncbi:hypothetical protein KR054_006388 [Drosophila jambulina]|nr:hypothetical protein KR054_006388 [Drosophila jambulina]
MILSTSVKFLRLARQPIRNLHQGRLPSARLFTGNQPTFTLESLPNRELIRVHGSEVVPFLQGLVTNDVSRIESDDGPASIYAHFLNKSGRVLFDTIIYRTSRPDTLLVECDREASSDLRRHLRLYRVRRRIDVDSVDDEYTTWVILDPKIAPSTAKCSNNEVFVAPDPRLRALGTRILAPADMSRTQLSKCFSASGTAGTPTAESNYQVLRYKLGVGEGTKELPPGKCFPLEANADYLNGVSFQKGCYVGQELTARIHHSGVVRKRYMPVRLTSQLDAGSNHEVFSVAGAKVGQVFGSVRNHGVALLRIEKALSGPPLIVDGEPCFADRPEWWPEDQSGTHRQAIAE